MMYYVCVAFFLCKAIFNSILPTGMKICKTHIEKCVTRNGCNMLQPSWFRFPWFKNSERGNLYRTFNRNATDLHFDYQKNSSLHSQHSQGNLWYSLVEWHSLLHHSLSPPGCFWVWKRGLYRTSLQGTGCPHHNFGDKVCTRSIPSSFTSQLVYSEPCMRPW